VGEPGKVVLAVIRLYELFFAIASVLTAYIAIEDFRHERIPNKALLLLLAAGLIYQGFFLEAPFAGIQAFLYALFIGVMLWYLGMWPAGDAKLFSILFLLLPPGLYSSQSLIFDFLINSFVPVFLFMLFLILLKSRVALLKESLKYSFDPYRVTMLAVILLGFVWLVLGAVSLLSATLSVWVDFFITIIILFIAFELLMRSFGAKIELFFIGCAVLRIALDYQAIYSLGFAYKFFSMLLLFVFFRFFIIYLSFKLYTDEVPIKEIKPGMVPAESIIKKGRKFEKINILNSSLISYMSQKKEDIIHGQHFLSKKDVSKIKKLRAEKRLEFKSLLVSRVQPFAVFLLAGFVLTVFINKSFIDFLALLLAG